MKIKSLFLLLIFFYSSLSISQNLATLDSKKGYMDIKIGLPISSIAEKVEKDIEVDNMYLISEPKAYYVENQIIDKIIIMVSEDDKKIIESITLMFVDKIKGLLDTANDTRINTEKRIAAFEEAKKLNELGFSYNFYNKLFKDAFGQPKVNQKGTETWNGKNVTLISVGSKEYGLITFAKVNSSEYIQKKKLEKGKKAANKF